jgi:pyruvate-ferredoxin/flavodoxin oxidoreductase
MKPKNILTEDNFTAMTGRQAVRFIAEHHSLSRIAGLSMTGSRAACWVSDVDLATESGSLRSSARRHLPLVVHLASGLYSGHGTYHGSGDAGCFQMYAADAQEAADFSLIAHRIAELSLAPGIVAQDAPFTTDSLVSLKYPSDAIVKNYLGSPQDIIETPTPAQRLLFGDQRRRLPEFWTVDHPMMTGAAHGSDSRGERTASNAPFFLTHLPELVERAFKEYAQCTTRDYQPLGTFEVDNADYVIVAQGSTVRTAEALAARMRSDGSCRLGVVNVRMLRPFQGERMAKLLLGKKGVLVLERNALVLREDSSLTRAIRTTLAKSGDYSSTPPLYSAFLDLGDSEARPSALTAAVSNMLSSGPKKVQLSVAFISPTPPTPNQEIQEDGVQDAYPDISKLSLPDEKPLKLIPEGTLALRIYAGDACALAQTSCSLAEDMAKLLGYKLHARPGDLGGVYHIGLSSQTLKISTARSKTDVAFLLDNEAGARTDSPAKHVRIGGIVVLQSSVDDPKSLWSQTSVEFRRHVITRKLKVFYADIRGTAEKAGRNRSRVLLGSLLSALKGFEFPWDKTQLKEALRDPDIKRGQEMLLPAPDPDQLANGNKKPPAPILPRALKSRPRDDVPAADIHRFFAQTGHRYTAETEPRNLADPFIGAGLLPGATGILRDHSEGRTEHPVLTPSKCTGCGDCWMVCPDSALPSRINDLGEILEIAAGRLQSEGHALEHLEDALHPLEQTLSELLQEKGPGTDFNEALSEALVLLAQNAPSAHREKLEHELDLLSEKIERLGLVVTDRFFTKGDGGLLSISISSDRCKGCLACVQECPEGALASVPQSEHTLAHINKAFALASVLPETHPRHMKDIDASPDDSKGYETLLLESGAYEAITGGHDGAPGSGAHTTTHLFAAAAAASLKFRRTKRVARVDTLIKELEDKVRLELAVDVEDTDALQRVMASFSDDAFTLSQLSEKLDLKKDPVDRDWLKRAAETLSTLKAWSASALKDARLGAVLGGETESSKYPYHPFSFPCTRLGSVQSPEMALGLFEGHMKKMAPAFAAFRIAELEIQGKCNPKTHDKFFQDFSWKDFTEEEFRLCPPVVIIVGAKDLYGPGLGALSALLSEGVPVKVLALDSLETPAHSALTAIVHPDVFVMQGGMGDPQRMMRSFVEGLSTKRPALFNIYRSTIAKDSGGSPRASERARAALESRAIPMFTFNPDKSSDTTACLNLAGNPGIDSDWIEKNLDYIDENGKEASILRPFTFVDFAAGERSFEQHLTPIPRHQWTKNMVLVSEFLDLDEEDQAESIPFIHSINGLRQLQRSIVSPELVKACKDRLAVWHTIRRMKRLDIPQEADIAARARADVLETVTQSLVELAG